MKHLHFPCVDVLLSSLFLLLLSLFPISNIVYARDGRSGNGHYSNSEYEFDSQKSSRDDLNHSSYSFSLLASLSSVLKSSEVGKVTDKNEENSFQNTLSFSSTSATLQFFQSSSPNFQDYDEEEEDDIDNYENDEEEIYSKFKKQTWPSNSLKDYAVSFMALNRLVTEEYDFYLFLKSKILPMVHQIENSRLIQQIHSYLTLYEQEVGQDLTSWEKSSKINRKLDKSDILNHPIMIFKLIRRFVFQFRELYDALRNEPELDFLQELNPEEWPQWSDFQEFSTLLIRLQNFYDFNIEEFVNGQFGSIKTNVKLDLLQIMNLGFLSIHNQDYASGVEWTKYSLYETIREEKRLRVEGAEDESRLNMMRRAFAQAVKEHDEHWGKTRENDLNIFTKKLLSNDGHLFNGSLIKIKRKYVKQLEYKSTWSESEYQYHAIGTPINFMTLCKPDSDQNWQTEEEKRKLSCWLKKDASGFSILAPFKMEMINHEPPLLLIHDFIRSKDIEKFKEAALPHLKSAMVQSENPQQTDDSKSTGGNNKNIQIRAGAVTWLDFGRSKDHFEVIEKKIEDVTGLKVKGGLASETFQVANSMPGGHFYPHTDPIDEITRPFGTRMATFMIYLSEVEVGGETAFPLLGLKVAPEPGMAIFWYNVLKNGDVDLRMIHGSCPVVLGQKWVSTKWIGDKANFLRRQCSLFTGSSA